MKREITQNGHNLKVSPIVDHVHSCHLHEVPFQTSFRFLKVIMCILLDTLAQLPPDSCKADSETVCTGVLRHLSLPLPKERSTQACPLLLLFLAVKYLHVLLCLKNCFFFFLTS